IDSFLSATKAKGEPTSLSTNEIIFEVVDTNQLEEVDKISIVIATTNTKKEIRNLDFLNRFIRKTPLNRTRKYKKRR
ncbi:hypothetical protein ACT01M_25695, partial [Enterobacter asburiae]|uniref:hypothetical protein n=1 Tax=Enterobacter asburiae TaxID=61645 RepID=UPI00402AD7D5